MPRPLTPRQREFLDFVEAHVEAHRVWPTWRAIADGLGYRSPNSIRQHLQALVAKGYVRQDTGGYHLVDREQAELGIAVRGTLRTEGPMLREGEGTLDLLSAFPDLDRLHALRLDARLTRPPALRPARFLLLADGDGPPNATLAVLHRGALLLRRRLADGRLAALDGSAAPLDPGEARVLGRYVGHAGPYGFVRMVEPDRA
ncbi:MAG TPA: hypothetical protein VD962_13075 [Rubricoccaceae bacterium]|nr:hypothetical protein [Rubricoccaceae bacterium]